MCAEIFCVMQSWFGVVWCNSRCAAEEPGIGCSTINNQHQHKATNILYIYSRHFVHKFNNILAINSKAKYSNHHSWQTKNKTSKDFRNNLKIHNNWGILKACALYGTFQLESELSKLSPPSSVRLDFKKRLLSNWRFLFALQFTVWQL